MPEAPTTDQVLDRARELGKMIGQHPAAHRLEAAVKALDDDVDAQRALTDYQRHAETLAQKQHDGKPIEVEDKHRLADLQKKVTTNKLIREAQVAEMDYLDLMRRVEQAMGERLKSEG